MKNLILHFDFDLKESRMVEEAARREKTMKAEEHIEGVWTHNPKTEENMENIYVVVVV